MRRRAGDARIEANSGLAILPHREEREQDDENVVVPSYDPRVPIPEVVVVPYGPAASAALHDAVAKHKHGDPLVPENGGRHDPGRSAPSFFMVELPRNFTRDAS